MNIPNWVGMAIGVGCLAVPLLVWIAQELRQAWVRRQAGKRRWARHAPDRAPHILGSAAQHPLPDVHRPLTAADWDRIVPPHKRKRTP
jgi:hypothetical protein